ncbi:MAG TPA: chloride channel protein [Synechococcales cyanobacterium M55_K2018_004]|nr:chloride channel protein [Synechococcales cyanobacterium M55_K2018_004]
MALFSSRQLRHLLVGSKRLAIYEACIIGVVSGLAAVFLKQGVGWLGGFRVQAASQYPAWLVLPLVGALGGLLSGFLIERFAPEAAGSGIPQVKAALANVPMALNLRVALVKLVTVIVTLASGLNLGRQGPTVQIGAGLAAQLSQWIPTSPEYRRQLIAAGAAAGLAAGFNAPIAGVLFVVEEFLQDFSGLTLGTAILASFIGAVVSRLLGGQGLSLNWHEIMPSAQFQLVDVPYLVILGLLAGALGGLFSQGIFVSLAFNRQVLRRLSLPLKIGLAGLISGLVAMMLPTPFRDNTGLQDFLSTGAATWQLTLLAFFVKFVLTLVAYGSGAPGGIFAPSLVLGSALGVLVGLVAQNLELATGLTGAVGTVNSTTTYALAGMGAFFSAVTRGPITAIVIVFEITTDFNLVLPLMIGSVTAYLVADRIMSGSLYTHLLAWNGIHLESTPKEALWDNLTAADLMQRRVETLASNLTVTEAVQAFSRSHHRGFPVVDHGKLVGIVTQSDLADLTRRPLKVEEATLADIMTPQPVTVNPDASLTHVLYLLNRFKLSRLPVTEGHKLVGIITRADIIRAESDYLSGETQNFGPQPEPSYVIYQTRSPATGKGRLLLPVYNPRNAPILLRLAAAIAQQRDYEIELLQVIVVPRTNAPAETPVRSTHSRRLLRHLETLGRDLQIPIHSQIRVSHDIAQAILETIQERHIDLTVMGWKGQTLTPGRVFGSVVDTLIRQAACEVVLVKMGREVAFDHWLIPIAGGPNAAAALQLLPAFTTLSEAPDVRICQVISGDPEESGTELIQNAIATLHPHLRCPVLARPIWGQSVTGAVTRLAWQEPCDVIVLGASREGMLKQVIQGNIPEAIARASNRTVILVRGAIAPEDQAS